MRCMWCPFACEDRSLLAQHIRSVHADKKQALDFAQDVASDAQPAETKPTLPVSTGRPMNCPFCLKQLRDLFGLSLHLEDEHPDMQNSVQVYVPRQMLDPPPQDRETDALCLPVAECDIDRIYRARPDLVGTRLACDS